MKNILILNGPNLNLVGIREPEIYGSVTMEDYIRGLSRKYEDTVEIAYYQSNHEGDIIDRLHHVGFSWEGIILNAGGYSHTSIAIADAVKAISAPVVEIHISDIYARETFRHHSYLKEVCCHHVIGEGIEGYEMAIKYLLEKT